MPKFFIEQIAICPPQPEAAIKLLSALGMTEWARDIVVARGVVYPKDGVRNHEPQTNVARLAFNYQATRDAAKPLEFEVLSYEAGENWMERHRPSVSHLGMHCTAVELSEFKRVFASMNIGIAQEVNTVSHVNPTIAGQRWYTYCIFNTRGILGVDLKFIVRRDAPVEAA
jgi:hypothetical protein